MMKGKSFSVFDDNEIGNASPVQVYGKGKKWKIENKKGKTHHIVGYPCRIRMNINLWRNRNEGEGIIYKIPLHTYI